MLRVGLACQFWHLEFPDRRFGDIAERRCDLADLGRLPPPRDL